MRINEGENVPAKIADQTYDHIYIESWKATLSACEKRLEPMDYERASGVNNAEEFKKELDQLKNTYSEEAPLHVIGLLYPALDHYEQFAQSFIKMMARFVEISMLWGLLYLVVKLSLESKGTIDRITRMLEKIGHKLNRLNQCARSLRDFSQIKGDTIEINREMVILWLNIIMTFRNQEFGTEGKLTLKTLQEMYEEAMRNIGDAVVRVEKVAELAERQARLIDLDTFQNLLGQSQVSQEPGRVPCHMLPVAENKRFFGRQEIIKEVDEHLKPVDTSRGLKSLAIYGLGGVGKTQIALAYAYSKVAEVDAVFWVPAETELAVQQGFSRIAVEGLQLPNAKSQSHQENVVMVINWLRRTTHRWLLIYDNVENHHIFNDYWPTTQHGAILVTTRKHAIASQPIDRGIEVKEFSVDDGAELLLHLLPTRQFSQAEKEAALEVSTVLNGYALAISQMAAYINARSMSISNFLSLYKKYPKSLHREKRPGWKYLGYNHALDTVWNISFEALDKASMSCLTVMSFLAPDFIPEQLFKVDDAVKLFENFSFCNNEMIFGDTIEQLTDSALVRHDLDTQTFSLHRLVQQECLFRISENDRQAGFDGAVTLLLNKFPNRGSMVTMDHLWEEGDKYLQQIAAVANDWHDSQQRSEPLQPSTDFCNLMADAAWFVHDNDTAGIMSLVIDCAAEAIKRLPTDKLHRLLWSDIVELLSIRDLTIGDFKSANNLSHEALKIRTELEMPRDLKMTNCFNYIALALDSLEQHKDAHSWLGKSADILTSHDEDDLYVRLSCQNNLNSARNLYCMGEYGPAEKRLDSALKQATVLDSWYSLGYVHETYASLFSRSGDLKRAHKHVRLAKEVLAKPGGFAAISWISGLCAYRAASVAILQGRVQDAIDEAKNAVAIGRLYKVPIGSHARSTHVLSKALFMDSSQQTEAEDAKKEAQRLRKLLPPGRTDLMDESDHAFDLLVSIIQR